MLDYCWVSLLVVLKASVKISETSSPNSASTLQLSGKNCAGSQFHSGDLQVIINESPIKGSDENGRVSQIVSVAVLIVDPTGFHSCPKTCFVCSLLLVFLDRPGVFLYSGQCESEWPVLCFRFKWASQASQGFLSY